MVSIVNVLFLVSIWILVVSMTVSISNLPLPTCQEGVDIVDTVVVQTTPRENVMFYDSTIVSLILAIIASRMASSPLAGFAWAIAIILFRAPAAAIWITYQILSQ